MKAIVWLGLMGLVAHGAFGQGARRMMQGDINRPPPPAPAAARFPPPPRPANRLRAPIFPLGFGGYGFGGYDYGYVPQPPNVVVIEAPPPVYAPVPERPPETATMVIHEYQSPSAAATQGPEGDQPTFAIVLKNTTILSATAVIVQNDGLHIVDPDGGHQQVAMGAVDREATRRVNRERKLQLQLPPGR
jgi:hypothetical protein